MSKRRRWMVLLLAAAWAAAFSDAGAATPAVQASAAPAPAAIVEEAPNAHDLALHNGFLEQARRGDLSLVFFGDSSTACWLTTGRDLWDKNIAPLDAADFGVYGNNARQLLWRLRNGELDGYRARAVVVMIGAVNLLHHEPAASVTAAITACVDEIRHRQPEARVLLFVPPHISVPLVTNAAYVANAAQVAHDLARLADGPFVQVLDMTAAMENRRTEALLQILVARDPHKAHVEFEVWWDALKGPLATLFAPVLPPGPKGR